MRTGPNPSGICMCGCGRKTALSRQTRVPLGDVAGQPNRYVLGHHNRQPLLERLRSKLKVMPNGCIEFTGGLNTHGYGVIGFALDGERFFFRTHRLAWELANGPIPDDLFVCHKCDNPPCCNPEHLFLGTHDDNMRDMAAKGRNYWRQRTHCSRGHLYTSENMYRDANGSRRCRDCRRVNDEARRAQRPTEAAS